jgi:hypothetical protein
MPLAMYALSFIVLAIATPMAIFWVTNMAVDGTPHSLVMLLVCMGFIAAAGLTLWAIPQ